MDKILEELEALRSSADSLCERLDDKYIELLAQDLPLPPAIAEGHERQALRSILTHLKDARAALERAVGAVP